LNWFDWRLKPLIACIAILLLCGCHDRQTDAPESSADSVALQNDDPVSSSGEDDEKSQVQSEIVLTPEAMTGFGIRVDTVSQVNLEDSIVVPARISFDRTAVAHVGTTANGRVSKIMAQVGDLVKPGDALVELESPELGEAENDLLQKRSALATARTNEQVLSVSYERARALYSAKAGTQAEMQEKKGALEIARGELRSAEVALQTAKNKLQILGVSDSVTSEILQTGNVSSQLVIRAPIAGQVIERNVTLGEVVGPDKEALVTLADTSNLWVLAEVPEGKLSEVKKGASARIKTAAMSEQVISGKVSNIPASTNPETRTGQVRIEVPNQNGSLKDGMFAQARISLKSTAQKDAKMAIAIPEDAVQLVDGTSAVFVPVGNKPGHFAMHPVTVGEPLDEMVPVYRGLSEGDKIVTQGSFILKADLGKGSVEEE